MSSVHADEDIRLICLEIARDRLHDVAVYGRTDAQALIEIASGLEYWVHTGKTHYPMMAAASDA